MTQEMDIKPEWLSGMKARLTLLRPGTIWIDKNKNQVYVDSVSTNLLKVQNTFAYVDYYDSFGLKHCKKSEFVAKFRYLGMARLKREELASSKNLILGKKPD